jgi:hypothetical protein
MAAILYCGEKLPKTYQGKSKTYAVFWQLLEDSNLLDQGLVELFILDGMYILIGWTI